jgi:hypothetical protein
MRHANPILYVFVGILATAWLGFWAYAFRDLLRNETFSKQSKTAWFWVVLILGPFGGGIAYLSAKANVAKFAHPDAKKFANLVTDETN